MKRLVDVTVELEKINAKIKALRSEQKKIAQDFLAQLTTTDVHPTPSDNKNSTAWSRRCCTEPPQEKLKNSVFSIVKERGTISLVQLVAELQNAWPAANNLYQRTTNLVKRSGGKYKLHKLLRSGRIYVRFATAQEQANRKAP